MYPRYLAEGVIGFALRALCGIYDIENAFFIGPYPPIFFATITKPCLAKEVFALVKTNANMYLKTGFDRNFLRKYNIGHLVLDLTYWYVLFLLGPCLCPYLYFIEDFEVLRLPICTKYLIHAKASKFDIFLRYETYCIEGFLVGNVT